MEKAALGLSLTFAHTQTTRAGSRYGSGRRRTPLTTLKIAAFAPMPSASVTRATTVRPGRFASLRKAKETSSQKSCTRHLRRGGPAGAGRVEKATAGDRANIGRSKN